MNGQPPLSRKMFQRLLESEDHDPLGGVSNLFDVAMVFAVALLVALFTRVPAADMLRRDSSSARSNARPGYDRIPNAGDRLDHFQVGDRETGGRGERLGIAYRLPSGEVVYVPEKDIPGR
jgi:hypothetical protein